MFAFVEPKEGTHHSDFIPQLVKITGCETFLELGVAGGDTAKRVAPLVKRYIGVDIIEVKEKMGEFYCCSTDEFFTFFRDPVDIVFIDANHRFESALQDMENSLRILNKYGLILLHDTDPIEEKYLDQRYCGDSYRIVEYICDNRPDLNILTLPFTEAGLSIVNRKSDRRVFVFTNKRDKK